VPRSRDAIFIKNDERENRNAPPSISPINPRGSGYAVKTGIRRVMSIIEIKETNGADLKTNDASFGIKISLWKSL
jgi:hypothetical protein